MIELNILIDWNYWHVKCFQEQNGGRRRIWLHVGQLFVKNYTGSSSKPEAETFFLHGFESGREFANHLITYVYMTYTKKLEPKFLESTPTSTTSFWILRIRIGLEVPAPKHWFIMPPLIILKSKQTGRIKVVIGYSENKLQPVRGVQIL